MFFFQSEYYVYGQLDFFNVIALEQWAAPSYIWFFLCCATKTPSLKTLTPSICAIFMLLYCCWIRDTEMARTYSSTPQHHSHLAQNNFIKDGAFLLSSQDTHFIYMDIHIVKNSPKLTGKFNSYQPLLRWTMKFLQSSIICIAIRHFL